jgi:hypothetical protein
MGIKRYKKPAHRRSKSSSTTLATSVSADSAAVLATSPATSSASRSTTTAQPTSPAKPTSTPTPGRFNLRQLTAISTPSTSSLPTTPVTPTTKTTPTLPAPDYFGFPVKLIYSDLLKALVFSALIFLFLFVLNRYFMYN